MSRQAPSPAGKLTHEQIRRTLERKEPVPKRTEVTARLSDSEIVAAAPAHPVRHPEARQSEFPVSRGGMHQESRHNKHNRPGGKQGKP
jgi:hypothetical protein